MLTYRFEGLDEMIKGLSPERLTAAIASTVNKVAAGAATEASRRIREDYNIKAGDVRQKLKLTATATANNPKAAITGYALGGSLFKFDAKGGGKRVSTVKTSQGRAKILMAKKGIRYYSEEVSVRVKTTTGRKIVITDPKAFMAQMKSGHIGVFQRIPGTQMTSKAAPTRKDGRLYKREQIRELLGPGLALLLGAKMEQVKLWIGGNWKKMLARERDYYRGR